ncbi:unnamed protein product [Parnassius mnemosyne]|uniref:HTH CENPB-type domain-containing protein n=1 Tax=Parnassius mnemosyne TaxID=213953 RepID=A0AAV1LW06_9NEOP
MPRIYIRKFRNTRNGKSFLPYTNYSSENLQKAIRDVKSKTLTLGEASSKYQIPKTTLSRKCRDLNCSQEKAGRPTLFSPEEEKAFIKHIVNLADWGFPFDLIDLRIFAQRYLNKLGKTIYGLPENLPGSEWARNFLRRHKDLLSNRMASNISTDRAKVSASTIDSFFEYFAPTIDGVTPDRIINYDETNLTDDPGNKKYIYKRGVKYPERVTNTSKTAVSLMFAATAEGQLLPVYVVYKAEHLWDTWLEGGPPDAIYNRSKSGWFDSVCFENWFEKVIVPYTKKKPGRKIVIGDNLSSHFSENVLKKCEKLNISFVCLPPKSTHLLQPLDVALYGPLKHYWRTILTGWKKVEGRKHKTLVKDVFPKLLAKLMNKLMETNTGGKNVIAGFNKCGLYPINPERPKSRLPHSHDLLPEEIETAATSVVIEHLKEMRGLSASDEPRRRKKRCNVPAGRGITARDIEQTKPKKPNKMTDNEFVNSEVEVSSSDSSEIIDISTFNILEPGPSKSIIQTKSTQKNKMYEKESNIHKNTKKGKGIVKSSKIGKENQDKNMKRKENGKKKCFEENNHDNALKQNNKDKKKKRNCRKISTCSTTSESQTISIYEDSDCIDENFDIDRDMDLRNMNRCSSGPVTLTENQEIVQSSDNIESKTHKELSTLESIEHIIQTSDNIEPGITKKEFRTTENIENFKITTPSDIIEPDMKTNKTSSISIPANQGIAQYCNSREKETSTTNETQENRDTSEFYDKKEAKVTTKEKLPTESTDKTISNQETKLSEEDIKTNFNNNDSEGRNTEQEKEYELNDHVIVRYINKKKWKYYIGIIENINMENEEPYTIRFYKTTKKPSLRFLLTRKLDRDIVPSICIVKKVNLIQNPNYSKEFFLSLADDDVVELFT